MPSGFDARMRAEVEELVARKGMRPDQRMHDVRALVEFGFVDLLALAGADPAELRVARDDADLAEFPLSRRRTAPRRVARVPTELRVGADRRRLDAVEERVGGRPLEIILVGVPAKSVVRIADLASVLDDVRDDVDLVLLRQPVALARRRLDLAEQLCECHILGAAAAPDRAAPTTPCLARSRISACTSAAVALLACSEVISTPRSPLPMRRALSSMSGTRPFSVASI